MRRRLGISTLPLPHASTSCQCGKQAASLGPEHALTCPSPQKLRTDRHDRIVAVLCDALLRAGIEHSKEPHLSAFADRTAGPGAHVQARRAARAVGESRGDILFHLRDRPTVLDVSVVTASAATYCAAAADTDGAAAAARDAEKHATYARRADTGYDFLPFSVETHGRLGRPARDFLRTLGRRSADASGGLFTSQQFVDGVLREISTTLCRSNTAIERTVALAFALPPGRVLNRAEACPSADVADRE